MGQERIIAVTRLAAIGLCAVLAVGNPSPGRAQDVYNYGDIPQNNQGGQGQLPDATLQNQPSPGEVETQQIGGAGWHVYHEVGALRCPAKEAIVGVRIRRGSVIDFMQVACAPIVCYQQGCTWSGKAGHFGPSAGNPTGGELTDAMYCPIGYVVSGFRAQPNADRNFLQTIGFECARLTRPERDLFGTTVMGIAAPGGQQLTGIGRGNFGGTSQRRTALPPRTWAPHTDESGQQIPGGTNRTGNYISQCYGGGASALSVAVGKWGVTQTPVIQAFSMFCAGTTSSTAPEQE